MSYAARPGGVPLGGAGIRQPAVEYICAGMYYLNKALTQTVRPSTKFGLASRFGVVSADIASCIKNAQNTWYVINYLTEQLHFEAR